MLKYWRKLHRLKHTQTHAQNYTHTQTHKNITNEGKKNRLYVWRYSERLMDDEVISNQFNEQFNDF